MRDDAARLFDESARSMSTPLLALVLADLGKWRTWGAGAQRLRRDLVPQHRDPPRRRRDGAAGSSTEGTNHMMRVLHPTYTLKVEIKDAPLSMQMQAAPGGGYVGQQFATSGDIGRHKYFNPLANKIGCDEVMAAVKDALAKAGLQATVSFDKFEQT